MSMARLWRDQGR
jgi:uncharacterized protein (DUF736 family)